MFSFVGNCLGRARSPGPASKSSCAINPDLGFLSLPLEIRLNIYSYIIGPSQCHETPIPYFRFTVSNTVNSDTTVFSRTGFRNWDHNNNNVWAKYPEADTKALSLTCRQINDDLREKWHPGPLALTIKDHGFFNIFEREKLYSAIADRTWFLARLEIVRLQLRVWKKSLDSLAGSRHSLEPLAHTLSALPCLKKIEVFITSSRAFRLWVHPFDDLLALQKANAKLCLILGHRASIEYVRDKVKLEGGDVWMPGREDSVVPVQWPTVMQSPQPWVWGSSAMMKRRDMRFVSKEKGVDVALYCEEEISKGPTSGIRGRRVIVLD